MKPWCVDVVSSIKAKFATIVFPDGQPKMVVHDTWFVYPEEVEDADTHPDSEPELIIDYRFPGTDQPTGSAIHARMYMGDETEGAEAGKRYLGGSLIIQGAGSIILLAAEFPDDWDKTIDNFVGQCHQWHTLCTTVIQEGLAIPVNSLN